MIQAGIITAPRPSGHAYLAQTVTEMRRFWDLKPHIFAEPDSLSGGLKAHYHHNEHTKGCVENWYDALRFLVTTAPKPWIMLCEDDIQFTLPSGGPSAAYMLRSLALDGSLTTNEGLLKQTDISFVSPYCSKYNCHAELVMQHTWAEAKMNKGWCGALCIFMPIAFARFLTSDKQAFMDYSAEKTTSGLPTHLDYAIGRTGQEYGETIVTHMPSLVRHTGTVSTRAGVNEQVTDNPAREPAE